MKPTQSVSLVSDLGVHERTLESPLSLSSYCSQNQYAHHLGEISLPDVPPVLVHPKKLRQWSMFIFKVSCLGETEALVLYFAAFGKHIFY